MKTKKKVALYTLLTTALVVLLIGCVRLTLFSSESDTRTNNLAPSILSPGK